MIYDRAGEILEKSCKLVQGRFRDFEYERLVNEKEHELSQSLIDLVELYRDNHPDSQSWLKLVRIERDNASFHIWDDFLQQWSSVLEASPLSWLFRLDALKLSEWMTNCTRAARYVSIYNPTKGPRPVVKSQRKLAKAFGSLLKVKPTHVAEVVSALTDIPPPEVFLQEDPNRKMNAVEKTNRRVLLQGRIVGSIFNILHSNFGTCNNILCKDRKPVGMFLLLGGSGCGKTEIAKAVAEHWYCDASRLVEIDMSECPELEFVDRVSEVVRKRPYSVIVLDNIDKAPSCVSNFIVDICSSSTSAVDFSKCIIFMTSDMGARPPVFACGCYNKSWEIEELSNKDPDPDRMAFRKTYKCYVKGYNREGNAVGEVRKFFGIEMFHFVHEVYLEFGEEHKKVVSRLLLREIVRDVYGSRFLVHISDAALNVLLRSVPSPTSGKAVKEALLADMRPRLLTEGGQNSDVVFIDTLIGSNELSFRFERCDKKLLVDRYLKQRDNTLGDAMANLRMKVKMACMYFELPKTFLSKQDRTQANEDFIEICKLLSPFTFGEVHTSSVELDNLPIVEEQKKKLKDVWMRLLKTDTGIAKATRVIINSVAKIINAPSARYYLFLCLDDDAKRGLNELLTESLRSSDSGKSFFAFVDLNNDNCRGKEVKEMMVEKVKECPYAVFMLDGVENADLVLYRSLLKIFDEGTLEDDLGLTVDFRRAIVILTTEAANKRTIAHIFNYKEHDLRTVATNQNVKRFRTELVHRVDEIILFDPILPEHGPILRLPKHDIRFKACSASTLSSTFLSNLFCPHDDPKDIYDMFKAMDNEEEIMRNRKNVCCE